MSDENEDIEQRLSEIEARIDKEESLALRKPDALSQERLEALEAKSDLKIVIGVGLILTSIFLLFNHVKVGSSLFSVFGIGQAGFGIVIIPLMIGLGIIFYNWKMRLGWVITAASCALIFFAVLSQLIMSFPTTSLLGLVIMFLPLAIGVSMVIKGYSSRPS